MVYTKKDFTDGETPISENNLDHMEGGIQDNSQDIDDFKKGTQQVDSAKKIEGKDISQFAYKPTRYEVNNFSPGLNTPRGITFDGQYFWIVDATDSVIRKLNQGFSEVKQIDAPNSNPVGITTDGTDLWVSDNGVATIYKIDTTGTQLNSFDSPGSAPAGLAFGAISTDSLWNIDRSDGTIYELGPDGSIISSFAEPGSNGRGLTYYDNRLYVSDSSDDNIYVVRTSTYNSGEVDRFFDIPASVAKGITVAESFGVDSNDNLFLVEDATEQLIYQMGSELRMIV